MSVSSIKRLRSIALILGGGVSWRQSRVRPAPRPAGLPATHQLAATQSIQDPDSGAAAGGGFTGGAGTAAGGASTGGGATAGGVAATGGVAAGGCRGRRCRGRRCRARGGRRHGRRRSRYRWLGRRRRCWHAQFALQRTKFVAADVDQPLRFGELCLKILDAILEAPEFRRPSRLHCRRFAFAGPPGGAAAGGGCDQAQAAAGRRGSAFSRTPGIHLATHFPNRFL